jgi:acetylornithine deacetylase/succinyl-diaminopimelate desuccinylase-like protein
MSTSSATSTSVTSALEWAADNASRFEEELCELLRIPSVSTQPEHAGDCKAAATWLANRMTRAGLEHAAVMPTGGHPIVYADWLHAGDQAPTVLVYGHYDVQPPEPLDEWNRPPFEPERPGDGNVYARGAADDKGQLFVHIASVEACLNATGSLPVNIKFFLEGEEESGSEHLDAYIEREADRLRADACLISDSHMPAPGQPALVASLRGMAYCEVTVSGPAFDLHSGTYGGAVRNPAEALARMIAACKDDSGHILIPGFYDGVSELDASERASLAASYDADAFLDETGVPAPWGEQGYSVPEQTGSRPTLEVNGIVSGYTGEGAKTVLPARAMAKVSMRLVDGQRWQHIGERFAQFMRDVAPPEVTVDVQTLHGGDPCTCDPSIPAMCAAKAALVGTFGKEPVHMRVGGSIPVVASIDKFLDIPTVLMGFGLPDDRLHSPNEKMSLDQFHLGIATSIRFWNEYANV